MRVDDADEESVAVITQATFEIAGATLAQDAEKNQEKKMHQHHLSYQRLYGYQKKSWEHGFKKSYSVLQQATRQHGPPIRHVSSQTALMTMNTLLY